MDIVYRILISAQTRNNFNSWQNGAFASQLLHVGLYVKCVLEDDYIYGLKCCVMGYLILPHFIINPMNWPLHPDELFCSYAGSEKLLKCPASKRPLSPQWGSPSWQWSPADVPDQPWAHTNTHSVRHTHRLWEIMHLCTMYVSVTIKPSVYNSHLKDKCVTTGGLKDVL